MFLPVPAAHAHRPNSPSGCSSRSVAPTSGPTSWLWYSTSCRQSPELRALLCALLKQQQGLAAWPQPLLDEADDPRAAGAARPRIGLPPSPLLPALTASSTNRKACRCCGCRLERLVQSRRTASKAGGPTSFRAPFSRSRPTTCNQIVQRCIAMCTSCLLSLHRSTRQAKQAPGGRHPTSST